MKYQTLHHLVLNLLSLLLVVPVSECAWKTYTKFLGYIPSYTYPITLNAGDTLRGFLSWPGTEDLDIYLYRNGMNLLSRSTYTDREFSPTLNPEDLVYTIPATDLYYLRVDLYSSVPTPYQFQISVNGQLNSSFYDTVITVTSGRTAQQFTVSGPCQIRVKYDGPIYNIYLFAPGVNVISGSPAASDTTSINPKYITHHLTAAGAWNLVIHHGLTSTTTLTPFNVVVETQTGPNECLNFCSSIPYTDGILYGLTPSCYCQSGFAWVSANQTCSIVCSSFNSTGVTGSRVNGTADECQCLDPAFAWNTTYLMCVIDCSLVAFATGTEGNTSCFCIFGFEWDAVSNKCVRNCSLFPFTAGASTGNVTECECISNFYWDAGLFVCLINCTGIPYTNVSLLNFTSSCVCTNNFYWNPVTFECMIDCSLFSGVVPMINGTVDACDCAMPNWSWNSLTFQCQINCLAIPYTNGTGANNTCLCSDNFTWDMTHDYCLINCNTINFTSPPYWISNVSDSCQCLDAYMWQSTSLLCVINCTSISYATMLVPNTTDVCDCLPSFDWSPQPPFSKCIINCSLLNNTVGQVQGSIDSCACRSKYQWANYTMDCYINCALVANTINRNSSSLSNLNGSCQCAAYFQWHSGSQQCVINCSLINNTLGPTGLLDQCLCASGHSWTPASLSCEPIEIIPQVSATTSLQWVSDDACSRQLTTQIKLEANPISLYTAVQLFYKNESDGQYYTVQEMEVVNKEYNLDSNSLKLTIGLLSDPSPSDVIVVLSNPLQSPAQPIVTLVSLPLNIATAFYSQSECSASQNVKNLVKFLPVAAYFVMAAGMSTFSPKIVGLQFFGALQLAYFSVSEHYESINIYVYELVGLKISNGANFQIYQQNSQAFYNQMPAVIRKDAKISGYLVNNFNVMYLIMLIFGLVFIVVYAGLSIYRSFIEKPVVLDHVHNQSQQELKVEPVKNEKCSPASAGTIVLSILKQGIVTILFFSLFNISFSSVIFYRYCKNEGTNTSALALSQVVFFMTIVIILAIIIDMMKTGTETAFYGQFKSMFKLNWLCRFYLPISILYRITLGIIIAARVEDMYSTLFGMFIAGIFLMFNIINLPFKSVLHNYRANLIHLTQLITLIVANYYRSMKANAPIQKKSHIHGPAILLLVCLTVSAAFSLAVILYQIWKKGKAVIRKCKKSRVENLDKENEPQMSSKREMSRANNNINITEDELH